MADFIGKWYMTETCDENAANWFSQVNNPCEFDVCLGDKSKSLKIATNPQSQVYKGDTSMGWANFPFKDLKKEMPCPPGHDCNDGQLSANRFTLKWSCVGEQVPSEAYSNDWPTVLGGAEKNGGCCGRMEGVTNYTVLARGKTYYFDQKDESWDPLTVDPNANRYDLNFWESPFFKCGDEFEAPLEGGRGWYNPRGCVNLAGPAYYVVDENGDQMPGFSFQGHPGLDGEGVYDVPAKANGDRVVPGGVTLPNGLVLQNVEKVYLLRDLNHNTRAGCVPGGNEFGADKPERILLIADNPRKELGKSWQVFSRQTQWGQTKEEVDKALMDSEGKDWLAGEIPVMQEISKHASMALGDQFADFFPDRRPYNAFKKSTGKGEKPLLLFLTNPDTIKKRFNVKFNRTPAINSFENTFLDKEKDATKEKCIIECDFDAIDRFCRCFKGVNYEEKPEAEGLTSNRAWSFSVNVSHVETVTGPDGAALVNPIRGAGGHRDGKIIGYKTQTRTVSRSIDIKFPSDVHYLGYKRYDISDRQVIPPVQEFLGDLFNAGNALKYNVNITDITSDLDRWYPDPIDNAAPPEGQNEVTRGYGQGLPGRAGTGRIENGMIVPPSFIAAGNQMAVFTSPQQYHFELLNRGNQITNDLPMESLQFTMVGFDIQSILPFMDPMYGLQGFNVAYGAQGIQVSFTFGTKYPDAGAVVRVSRDTLEQSIALNAFGRAY
jgi:hypothetical protein